MREPPRPARAPQVKKKMTADEFVRNNRGINGGEDLPRDFLRALYASIAADEIRISSEAQARARTPPYPSPAPAPPFAAPPRSEPPCAVTAGAEAQASASGR
jgi:hypothetical protein